MQKASFTLGKFIDFNKNDNTFYNNLYIKDLDFVVKIPMRFRKKGQEKIKLEKFDLAKYTYLIDYE